MNRPLMVVFGGMIFALGMLVAVLAGATGRSAFALFSPTAHEADVNQSGTVDSTDLLLVARCFGRHQATDTRLCTDNSTFTPTPTITPTATATSTNTATPTATSTPALPDLSPSFGPCAYAFAPGATTTVHIGCVEIGFPLPIYGWSTALTEQSPTMAGPAAVTACTSTGTPWVPVPILGAAACGDTTFTFTWIPGECRGVTFTLPGPQGAWVPSLRVELVGVGPFPTMAGYMNVPLGGPPC